jgi:hypothetical protein
MLIAVGLKAWLRFVPKLVSDLNAFGQSPMKGLFIESWSKDIIETKKKSR